MKHFVLLLHAGDYWDAAERSAQGLPDRYRHHSYALESLTKVRALGFHVTVVQMYSPSVYDKRSADGIRFVGFGRGTADTVSAQLRLLLRAEPATHVMLRTPSTQVLHELARARVRVSVVLADSFPSRWRHWRRYRELGRLLNGVNVDFVSNHHLNSARQLRDVLRVSPSKIVPWDWPLDLDSLSRSSAKSRPPHDQLRLCYAGSIQKSKGVADAISLVHLLRNQGESATLEIAGAGDVQTMQSLIDRHNLGEHVTFLGRIGGDEILAMMQRSAFVCVPSHHTYPEGLPLTLFEAMASGTPLVASDHPMFRDTVVDGENGFVFRAGRPKDMARAVHRGWDDADAYARVSATAAARYRTLGLSTLWGDVLVRWLRGSPEDVAWLHQRSLRAST